MQRHDDLRADNERLRAALRKVLELAHDVAAGDAGACWRALGAIEQTAKHALGDDDQAQGVQHAGT